MSAQTRDTAAKRPEHQIPGTGGGGTMYEDRIRNPQLRSRILSAEEAAAYIQDGMTVGISGFTRAGDAKAVPMALAERVQHTGERLRINLWTGASVAEEVDRVLADAGVI
ncbi:MAG: hypothetical protein K6T68_15225, partial [Alicyclobacillus shizuokensis]|nr:hypothetical protein [Alicyclobacillus shizuokensis]